MRTLLKEKILFLHKSSNAAILIKKSGINHQVGCAMRTLQNAEKVPIAITQLAISN